MGFGESSILLKINFILLIVTFLIHILGLALPHWVVVDTSALDLNFGLWQSCSNGNCIDISNPRGNVFYYFIFWYFTRLQYSQLSLSRLRLSRITAYLEEKTWSLF